MTKYLSVFLAASLMPAAFADHIAVPPVPSNLQVPAGHTVYLKGEASGTQNYICQATPTGFAWTLFGPQATLFLRIKWFGGDLRQQITTHFLSANPVEGGTLRPTWQSSLDTSAVWGRATASSTDPAFVAAGAIPWLLVEIVGKQAGTTGSSLTLTTYIQRLGTSGGVAPATGCGQASQVGSTVLVPYTTDYYFYRSQK